MTPVGLRFEPRREGSEILRCAVPAPYRPMHVPGESDPIITCTMRGMRPCRAANTGSAPTLRRDGLCRVGRIGLVVNEATELFDLLFAQFLFEGKQVAQ